MQNFIHEEQILTTLKNTENPLPHQVKEVLTKAKKMQGLSLQETALLTQVKDPLLLQEIFDTARYVKETIYGNRMVFFAPLYVTNQCQNDCLYCGFRSTNTKLKRRTLTMPELAEEVKILEDMGHKRVLLVYGESQKMPYLIDSINTVYQTRSKKGEIRRVNVNSAPLTVEEFKELKAANIGTYQCFQETYHQETYKKVHLSGKKTDYFWRLFALDRALQAGLDDVATGVLFGLYDWKFEVLALLEHSLYLEKTYGVGPHTISFPRLEPALNAPISKQPPYPVDDEDFKKIIAIVRLAVPYTGIILTTRENPQLRRELFALGVSQISAGSRTYPGGYHDSLSHVPDMEQFTLGDTRPLDEVIADLLTHGYVPSFCTGCYRLGRTGHDFMDLAKPGEIHQFCSPNALLTLTEYLEDYASEETKKIGIAVVKKEKKRLGEKFKPEFEKKLEKILKGDRDLFF